MTDEPRNLTPGPWWVDAPCPRCGEVEVLPVSIGVVLTTPGDDTPTLRVTAEGGKTPHACGQTRTPMPDTVSMFGDGPA